MLFSFKKPQTELNCSVGNLLRTSLPMIVSILSSTLMYLLDRVFLANYSFIDMNAASAAHQALEMYFLPLISFATISEVFVGQFNGGKQYEKTSVPIIQITLFLSLIWLIVLPISLYTSKAVIPQQLYKEGFPYFLYGMLMLPFIILFSALSAFFVGTRRPQIVLVCALVENLVNILFDVILIFGVEGYIKPMGAKGAAIASLIAIFVGSLLLLIYYFSATISKTYSTRKILLDKKILRKNIFLGMPYAFCEFIEMTMWVILLNFLAKVSMDSVTVQNVCVTVWIFLAFLTDGFQKGVIALASNCIGGGKEHLIKKLIRSMGKVTLWFAVLSSIPFVFFVEEILKYVFCITQENLLETFKISLFLLWIVQVLLLITNSCLAGILSAGGDTKYVTFVKLFSITFTLAIPIYIFYMIGELTVITSWWLSILQQLVNCSAFYYRYSSHKWNHNLVNKVSEIIVPNRVIFRK